LERDGLVRIGPGADGRSKTVVVTAKGRRKLAAAMPLWSAAQKQVLRDFGTKRWNSLRGELDAMRASLRG
jgi:DNA-binding MarR family transcriptional regulator